MLSDDNISYDDIVVPPRGAAPSLPAHIEYCLKEFLDEAYDIGIPRSKQRCATDIQAYVTHANLSVPFVDNRPGMRIQYYCL